MSGPKGCSYRVVSAEELLRREMGAARARCDQLENAVAVALAERDALTGATAGQARRTAKHGLDLADLTKLASRLEGDLRGVHAEVVAARQAKVAQDLLATFGTSMTGAMGDVDLPTTPSSRGRVADGTDAARRLLARVDRCVELTAGIDEEATRASVLAVLADARAAAETNDETRAERTLLLAQTDVDRMLRHQATEIRVREHAEHAVLAIADLTGPEVDQVRSAARAARTGADAAWVEQEVERLRADHTAAEDRRYVLRETQTALIELGYDVGEDFEVVAATGSPTVITRAGLPDHGLQLTFLPGTTRLLSNVVAFGETSPARDREVEDTTCRDLESLQDRWREHGISGEFQHRQDAGSVPVERVERARRARARANQEKSR